MSYLKTAILLAGLTGLFMGVGYLIGGANGALIALVIAAATNLFAYWNSDRMVLSMYGAHEVDQRTAPDLFNLVAELAGRAGLPMPRVFIMDEEQPNAFATGRNPQNAAVAVTRGLMHSLSREELAGVIAHELAHIKNHDTLLMTITATIAGAISMVAQFGMFFGGNRNSNNGLGSGHRSAPCWGRWRSAGRANTPPTISARGSAASRCGWRPRWPRSPTPRIRCRTRRRSAIRQPRTCSSSTRCRATASTTCSRRTPRPRTASPRCSSLRRRWALRAERFPSIRAATTRAAVRGGGRRPHAVRGGELGQSFRGAPLGANYDVQLHI
jgi:hypothetical protein